MADTFLVIGTGPTVNIVLSGAGASAYQIWLDEGNTGTEQDFLDSLVGADGPQGPAGDSLWTDGGAFTYLASITDRIVAGSATELDASYQLQSNGGIYSAGSSKMVVASDVVALTLKQHSTQTTPIFRIEYSTGALAGYAHIFNSTNRSTVFGAVGSIGATSANNLVFGYSPNLVLVSGAGNNAYFNNGGSASNSGYENSFFGISAGIANTTGFQNSAIGYQALSKMLTGYQNMAIGRQSMFNATSGNGNVGIGANSLKAATAPSSFVAIGESAAPAATTATTSCVVGQFAAGNKTTVTGSVIIGQEVASTAATGTSIANQLWIDNSSTTTPLIGGDFSTNRVGINTAPGAINATLQVSGPTGYSQFNLAATYTPSSSADALGSNGDFAYDSNYIYVKVGGSWKRSALSTF